MSDEARTRVLDVIREHNYRPNAVARSLATDRTYEICILAPRWKNDVLASGFWSLIFLGLSERCFERGYYASLSMVSAAEGKTGHERFIAGHNFDGYVLIHKEVIETLLPSLLERKAPIVSIGHDPSHPDVSSVDVDNFRGAFVATRHLLSLGHERIALVLGSRDRQESIDRFNGYEQALMDAGIKLDENLVVEGDYSQLCGQKAFEKLLRQLSTTNGYFLLKRCDG